ncbi:MAG: RNA methyltransferase [Lewinellaceae bacterium]|jgi:23S rRNA (guanosine2251-2'-O)-methyltransferase|nr:RNA methyltransferase [Lewinellaceae bacterium]
MEKLSLDALNRISVEAFREQKKMPLVLVLDNVRSALNVGSIFRTADAFAVERIILCGITARPPHREILKTALGSTDSVAWEYFEDTPTAVSALKTAGYKVLAVEQTTHKTWLQDFHPDDREQYALLLGNEVEGVGEQALALCDGAIEIPQSGTKHSLNVAVAAGIAVWEFARKTGHTSNKS